jgi:anti-sigma regulatory factor (Ser/Thr protein kinase)
MTAQDMDGGEQQLETTLPAEPGSAPRARATVAEHSRAWGFGEELCDDATLIVTELVANAIRHAGTTIELRLRRIPEGLRLEVSDGSPRPVRPASPSLLDEGGRGLALVDALATHYGVEGHPTGKTVWVELHGS